MRLPDSQECGLAHTPDCTSSTPCATAGATANAAEPVTAAVLPTGNGLGAPLHATALGYNVPAAGADEWRRGRAIFGTMTSAHMVL